MSPRVKTTRGETATGVSVGTVTITASAIIQYPDSSLYYVSGPLTDCDPGKIHHQRFLPKNEPATLVAFIHTHPFDYPPNSSPFNESDLEYDEYPDRYVIVNNARRSIYRLPTYEKNFYSGWEIYR